MQLKKASFSAAGGKEQKINSILTEWAEVGYAIWGVFNVRMPFIGMAGMKRFALLPRLQTELSERMAIGLLGCLSNATCVRFA